MSFKSKCNLWDKKQSVINPKAYSSLNYISNLFVTNTNVNKIK